MLVNLINKITLLAPNAKILQLGKQIDSLSDTVEKTFKTKEYYDITAESLDILNSNLYDQFDVVVLSLDKKRFEMFKENEHTFPENIIYIIDDDIYEEFRPYINKAYSILMEPISQDIFLAKVFGLFAINEANSLLKTKQMVINKYKDNSINNEIDSFLDQYSGSMMFINDDLNESLQRLKDLEISKEVFSKVSVNLVQLSNIFEKNENLTHLANLFKEFSQFIDSIDFESIEPSRFVAFDYLTTIIEDTILYIDELFVYRLFKDVKVFQDSMENNITYFEAKLFGKEESNDDNLEFF